MCADSVTLWPHSYVLDRTARVFCCVWPLSSCVSSGVWLAQLSFLLLNPQGTRGHHSQAASCLSVVCCPCASMGMLLRHAPLSPWQAPSRSRATRRASAPPALPAAVRARCWACACPGVRPLPHRLFGSCLCDRSLSHIILGGSPARVPAELGIHLLWGGPRPTLAMVALTSCHCTSHLGRELATCVLHCHDLVELCLLHVLLVAFVTTLLGDRHLLECFLLD